MQHLFARLCVAAGASTLLALQSVAAADWSDTSLGYRYGTTFAEPFNSKDIGKNVVSLTHASGGKYGTDFFNVDLLSSDNKDSNASEAYLVYRHTFDVGTLSGREFKAGPARGLGLTGGFDLNTKNDPGYGSKKRMLVAGPTLMLDVPSHLNVSLLMLIESNFPVGISSRYHYKTHPAFDINWGIPLSDGKWYFQGYADYIAAKGPNEFGGPTAPETNIDMALMLDFSAIVSIKPNSIRGGFGYQYWRNKFGNPSDVRGSLAKTPTVRAEYHF